MSKKSRFRGAFDIQHGKCAQALLKFTSETLYNIQESAPRNLSRKKSLLLTCKILGLLLNTLATDEKYLVLHRDNLTKPIQMHLSRKKITFFQFFAAFVKSRLSLDILNRKMTLIDFVFWKLQTSKSESDKSLKSHVSEEASTSNMVDVPKQATAIS